MASFFSRTVVRWYQTHGRDLPWRRTADPYRIWLSEVILQQTQVSQGLPYYERFLQKYPTVAALAAAMYRGAQRAAETGGFEAVRTLQLEATGGHMVVTGAGDVLVIAVADRDAQLGLIRVETLRAAESLQ